MCDSRIGKILTRIFLSISIPGCLWAAAVSASAANPASPAADGLIIKYRESVTDADLQRSFKNGRLRFRKYVRTGPMEARGRLGVVNALSVLRTEDALEILRKDPAVEHVEPNYRVSRQAESNDPFFTGGQLWGVDESMFSSKASVAWAAGLTGSASVHVAVIDDGAQINHEDLALNIWTNPFEIAGDGLDNDGNGFIDDVNGWNFVGDLEEETNFPYDPADGHGTLVSGMIGAVGGNGIGGVGINWDVTIIPLRSLAGGTGALLDIVEAIDYCVDLKSLHPSINLVAINASWGFSGDSQFLHDAVIRAAKAGILFVAAAGNSGADNDVEDFSPANINTTVGTIGETAASYNSVISVAAIDSSGDLATFSTGSSSYGLTNVHIGAPGKGVIGPHPDNLYYVSEGTSLAAPFVTGAVALYASAFPGTAVADIRAAILAAAEPTVSLVGKTTTGGRLDLTFLASPPVASVVGRHLFYNRSAWDGSNPSANASDDAAIATDKTALLPGNTATFANYGSYSRGINGIMVDIANPGNGGAISSSDFTFKVGNNNTPAAWANAPAPTSVTRRAGEGLNGSDRFTIIWADNAIQKQWLQVTVLASANTGLSSDESFYFGNAIGETGNSLLNAQVNSSDQNGARNNPHSLINPAPIHSPYDFNRDKRVNSSDENFARINNTTFVTALKFIQVP